MARSYARVSVQRFHDEEWRALPLAEKAVFDMLLGHPKLSICGALDVKLGSLARYAPDLDAGTLAELLGSLEDAGYIRWDRDTDELVIRTFVRHDGVLQNQNLGRGMWAAWLTIESDDLRQFIVDNVPDLAFEERFRPPDSALRNRRSIGGSHEGSERRIEAPQPKPKPYLQPASADRSIDRFEHVAVDNGAPVVRLAQMGEPS